MAEEFIRTVEIPSVKLEIVLDKEFYDELIDAKEEWEEMNGREYSVGEYLMHTVTTLMSNLSTLEKIAGVDSIDSKEGTHGMYN